MSDSEPEIVTERKRKRQVVPEEDELEIDVNAPEPPSKKAKRKEKKDKKSSKSTKIKKETAGADSDDAIEPSTTAGAATSTGEKPAAEKRSEYGIWIGNLPWSATKDSLKQFFVDNGGIDEKSITRLHMPAPIEKKGPQAPFRKPMNKGFAYVDFASKIEFDLALALTEKLMLGRKVLIKDAKSFEGRPVLTKEEEEAKKAGPAGAVMGKKEPSQRIFVGNLGFDVSADDLTEHFSQAGEVEDVHMATFQDTGKCKGYGWVRFVELEAAEAAVRGFVFREGKGGDEDEDEEDAKSEQESDDAEEKPKAGKKKKKEKKRKWFINRLAGRPLRCEFAEDAQTRYKKRFGKTPAEEGAGNDRPRFDRRPPREDHQAGGGEEASGKEPYMPPRQRKMDPEQREAVRRQKHKDARMTAPGKALATAQRASNAIVAGQGKKITF